MRPNIVAAIVLIALTLAGCRQQGKSVAPTTAPAIAESKQTAKADPIIAGDLLHLYVPELHAADRLYHKAARVDLSGEISLPYAGAIKLVGLSLAEAETAINEQYRRFALVPPGRVTLDREESGKRPSVKPGPIAPGDSLRLQLNDLHGPGLPTILVLTVSEEGQVSPLLLGRMQVAGLTEMEAEKAISEAYQKANIMKNAEVYVLRISPQQAARWRDLLQVMPLID